MEFVEIATDVYACLQEDKGLGWNNAGFVNLGGGLVIDTFYDLNRTREMISFIKTVSTPHPKRLVNTHHNGDHTWGNQLFRDSEIIAHRLCAKQMQKEKKQNLPGMLHMWMQKPKLTPPGMKQFLAALSQFDISEIELTIPNHLIEDDLDLELDGYPCRIIYVGPAHTSGDLIVYLPDHKVIFAGDIVFWKCTPIGWEGIFDKWIEALDLMISLKPKVIVPGHGPLCGVEEVKQLRRYFEFVYSESKRFFDEGLDPFKASKRIKLGPYADWTEPERLYFNVNRAYREFRNVEPWDAPVNALDMFSKCVELRKYWNNL
ncbi:MAG: MBL fold metallo-hydrolase [Promethearchaeota archaeon]|jgi:glyoxylase-like metal-dependent hydrolase (beta-lactamase superfamily II)